VGPAVSPTEVEDDVDGGPSGGALPMGPVVSTTEVEDDVDSGPPRGHYRWVRQRPPPRLETMSMVGPMGGHAGGSGSVRHQV
jgi:hypothetical protein